MARNYIHNVTMPNVGNGTYLTLNHKPGGQLHSSYNRAVVSLVTTKPIVKFYTSTVTCREQRAGGVKSIDIHITLGTKLVKGIEVHIKIGSNTYSYYPDYNTELEDNFALTVSDLLAGVSVTITGKTAYGSSLTYTDRYRPILEENCPDVLTCASDSSVSVFYVRDLSFPLKVLIGDETPVIFYTFLDMTYYFAERGLAIRTYNLGLSLPPTANT